MKNIFTTLFILVAFSAATFSQTQAEMTMQFSEEYNKADKELNQIYGQLVKKIDPQEKQALVATEKAWIAYRDLQCKFECMSYGRGSMYSMQYSACMTSMTKKRTSELKEVIKEREEN